MITWEEIVKKQIIDHQDVVSEITRPLREHFGIEFFNYHRIDNDGSYFVLLDRPDWAEHYVSNAFYSHDPFLQNPDTYSTGSCLLEVNGNEEYQNTVIRDGVELFGIDTGLINIYRSEDFVEFYCYSGHTRQSAISHLALENKQSLLSFEHYFAQRASRLMRENHDQGANLRRLKGKNYEARTQVQNTLECERYEKFLSDIGMNEELRLARSLTKRERECVAHLLDGLSMKEIGVNMKISPRTVEYYLDNIKRKFGCLYKSQLIPIARKLDKYKLL